MKVIVHLTEEEAVKALPILLRHSPGMVLPHRTYVLSEAALRALRDAKTHSSVIARLGVADVRAFGLTWGDCEEHLRKLGFSSRVEVVAE